MKRYIYVLLSAIFTLSLSAETTEQDTVVIHRNITIERNYQPIIRAATKINSSPFFIEPRVVRKTTVFNTDFSQPLTVERSIHQLASAELIKIRPKQPEGFARVGAGIGFNTLADFAFPLVKNPNTRLDFILNHYGFHNDKAHSTTQAALLFNQKMRRLDFYAGLSGGHEYFKYYAYDELNGGMMGGGMGAGFGKNVNDYLGASNTLWRLNANTGIRNSQTTDELRWGIHLDYNLFNMTDDFDEQAVTVRANISSELGEGRLGIDLTSTNLFYSIKNNNLGYVPSPVMEIAGAHFENRNILAFNPYYSFEREVFDLRLGVNLVAPFGKGNKFRIIPDARFEWRIVPRTLALYAGVGGDYQVNSLNNIYLENIYLNPDVLVDDTYTPFNFFAGTKFSPLSGLLLDAFVNYRTIDNQYFFGNMNANRFFVLYSQANHFRAGGRISYNYHDRFNAQLGLAYNHWNVEDFTQTYKPAFEMNFNANVRITTKLNVFTTMNFEGKRYADFGLSWDFPDGLQHSTPAFQMQPIIDLNLGASYALQNWMSVFVRANNLLNRENQRWYGYNAQGFNVMAGAAFSF
jgi:hypothetical protein